MIQRPTRRSIRWILDKVLASPSDLDAFCLDYFPKVYHNFATGQDRRQRVNLLLIYTDTAIILDCLRNDPEYRRRLASLEKDLVFEQSQQSDTYTIGEIDIEAYGPDAIAQVRVIHPLPRAPHFCGRKTIVEDLINWWKDFSHQDRVRSLTAAGGTGKTAIAGELLQTIRHQPTIGHIFVWSFYESADIDSLFDEMISLFAENNTQSTPRRLEYLQRAFGDGRPHFIILDGLEAVQSQGQAHRAFGELLDHQLRIFLRSIAEGLGKTRALVTSRFHLADLSSWVGSGYHGQTLDDLDSKTAITLLRAWEVKGSDDELDRLALRVGRHALSVSVLGSFLKSFCNGSAVAAPKTLFPDASENDPQAAKLARVLAEYARSLPIAERDFLARLCVFPRGVAISAIYHIANAGGLIAGSLDGYKEVNLTITAQKLVSRGLAFVYGRNHCNIYSSHPFIRDYFRGLLGVNQKDVFEVVRAKLAPTLEARPQLLPRDTETLNRYELLIESTRLSDKPQDALDLFWYGIGGYDHLGSSLGEYSRGVRILTGFLSEGELDQIASDLPYSERTAILSALGLFSIDLGDLKTAQQCFDVVSCFDDLNVGKRPSTLTKSAWEAILGDYNDRSLNLQNATYVALQSGELTKAYKLARSAFDLSLEAGNQLTRAGSAAYLGAVCHAQGLCKDAESWFNMAVDASGYPLVAIRGVFETRSLFDHRNYDAAFELAQRNLLIARRCSWNREVARYQALLGRIAVRRDLGEAQSYASDLREWVSKTGDQEATLESHMLTAIIRCRIFDLAPAVQEAKSGLHLADICGFGLSWIEFNLLLSRVNLSIPDYQASLDYANQALNRAAALGYIWGEASARYLRALALRGQNELSSARAELAASMKIWCILEDKD